MNSFEELIQKVKDFPEEKLVKETQATVNAEITTSCICHCKSSIH